MILAIFAGLAALGLVHVTAASAANPSANLDQCANDPLPSLHTDGCDTDATQWVNGNLGASKSVYFEGDSIPYRLRFDNLVPGATVHNVVIQWDTTKSSKHAIDYVDTFNASVADANPCLGVSGCNPATFSTRAIPVDGQVGSTIQQAGVFTLYGGTITNISAYSYSPSGFTGDTSASLTISFTASVANPVLAWGGHIATRKDWGFANSAVAISGSPYHTRLISLDGAGGNQDRSLSAAAVIFPGQITVIKDAVPNSSTSFPFTDTGAEMTPSSFSLVDDGTASNTRVFSGLISFGSARTVTETQPPPAHWSLTNIVCSLQAGDPANPGTTSTNLGTGVATINLNEGDFATCTYTNTHSTASPTIATTLSATSGAIGTSVHDSATLSGATSDAGGTVTYSVYSDNTCSTLVASAGTKTVTNGSVPDSDSVTFNSAGTFYWQASYSGDANNNGATSTCTSEVITIAKNSPTIATTLSASSIIAGGSVHDSATLSGATSDAGGTVTYAVYSNNTCTTQVASAGTKTVTNGSVPDSDSVTFNSAGTFYWQASYSGDANNNGATSACTSETLVVTSPNVSQITPTQTTCTQFSSGTAGTLGQLLYTVKSGKVFNVTPGVFFYWVKVTATAGSNTFTINQAITTGNFDSHFFAQASGSQVFDGSCTALKQDTITTSNGVTTVTFNATTAGTYFIGIKYDSKSVTGFTAPSPTTTVHYDFSTANVSGSTSGLDLVKQ